MNLLRSMCCLFGRSLGRGTEADSRLQAEAPGDQRDDANNGTQSERPSVLRLDRVDTLA